MMNKGRINDKHGGYRPGAGAKGREFNDTELRRIKDMIRQEFTYKAIAGRFGTYSKRIKEIAEGMEQIH